jgi:hypothetical protein
MSVPAELAAQGNSNRARQQQVERRQDRQREQAREQSRRDAERDRMRREEIRRQEIRRQEEIRREANRRGLVIRRDDDRRDRDRRDDRYDDRNRRDDPWDIFGRRDDRRDDAWYDERYDRRGPAFCRSGQGHPVHGRQWCRQKGFGLGRENSRDIWGDIIYRDRRYDDRRLSRSTLGDILGSVVLGRFDSYGRQYHGSSGALNGRWLDNRGAVLQLFMGSTPIARLVDTNRDGRVDSVSLMR